MMTPGGSASRGAAGDAPVEKRSCPLLSSLVLLISAIVLKASLISIWLVAPCSHSGDQPAALQQKFMEWQCVSAVPQGKGRGWTCCPKGWKRFQGSCYYLSDDTMPWADSVQNCTGMGSHLVVINTKAEQVFLTEEVRHSALGFNHYIGLSAPVVGQWQWADRTPYNETAAFWRSGEPTNVTVEKCVVIHKMSNIRNWNDIRCEHHYRICEAAAVTV
ncbi:C-type lectin domain family 4 member E-like isoform X1 [Ciconia boyciana]|uniref:C-type lectin domain family 4 member E-like isoform X1 n=1 Tax=Ciconia boyciana TaxID=52775 RepID=UPI003B9E8463